MHDERGYPPPVSGGMDDQPYEWQLLLDIGHAALDRAKEEARKEIEDAEEQRQREREAQQPVDSPY